MAIRLLYDDVDECAHAHCELATTIVTRSYLRWIAASRFSNVVKDIKPYEIHDFVAS